MRWPWRLHREWQARAQQACAEAERSRQALEDTRRELVAPMSRWREHNHFAELLRASLIEGHRRQS